MTDNEIPELKAKQAAEDEQDEELLRYLRHIGATSLATELNDLRFRNRVVEAQRFLDTHEAKVAYEEQLHDKIDQRLMGNQSVLFDKSQAYMNFVVTLGYAGFFAIWNLTKNFMHPWDTKLIAVLLGASLLVFIFWTLVSMISSNAAVNRIGSALRANPDGREAMLEAVLAADAENLRRGLWLQKFWPPTFTFSVATGFAAGMILLVLLMGDVVGRRFTLHDLLPSVEPAESASPPTLQDTPEAAPLPADQRPPGPWQEQPSRLFGPCSYAWPVSGCLPHPAR